ncbi:MAG: hypothetical protein COW65_12540 [Cytophagales bacterium CG18_big_fil_WC_8_21_14_2_50_42_9]|nr:MAG: hypothetical protein COW65_12540 [Cytophagales bacterium CG18_big_fil_WC_8_21_14_2_50_42_9]
MLSPLSRTLIKIFAKGFYRVHAGLLLALFIIIFIYFLFINVLEQTRITPEERLMYNLSLVLAFITNPVVMAVVFILWLIYTVKSWQYVAGQLRLADQQFIFYSSTAMPQVHQFKSWFLVQAIILLPIISYGLFSLAIGIMFDYFVMPVIILLYILLLTVVSALVYIKWLNKLRETENQSYLLKIAARWRKPFFSLFIYHVFAKLKLAYGLTKILSGIAIAGLLHFFSDVKQDIRVAGIIVLTVITAHTILIYQEHRFKEIYMGFSRNLPYRRRKLLADYIFLFILLLLPESIWLLVHYKVLPATGLFLFGLSTALLFCSLLYWLGLNMRKYLRWVGGLFLLFLLLIMFGCLWFLVFLNLGVAFLLFYRNYYAYNPAVDT